MHSISVLYAANPHNNIPQLSKPEQIYCIQEKCKVISRFSHQATCIQYPKNGTWRNTGKGPSIIAEHVLHKEIAAHQRNAHTHTHHTIKWPVDKWNQINRWRYSVTIENYTNYTIIMGKFWQMISVGKFGSGWGCTALWPTARNVSNIKT